jgi:hypothetical protein
MKVRGEPDRVGEEHSFHPWLREGASSKASVLRMEEEGATAVITLREKPAGARASEGTTP